MAQTKIERANLATTGTPDGSKFLRDDMAWESAGGGLISYTVYTGGDTWRKTTNSPTKVVVEVQGGGGSSGSGAGNWGFGGSGGSGGYVRKFIDVSSIDEATIVVGAGGIKNNGTSAGDSSWDDDTNLLTGGAGGNGGNGGTSPSYGNGGTAGTATGGDINIPGGNGAYGQADQASARTTPSFFSGGPSCGFQRTALSYGAALAGSAYGAGSSSGRGNDTGVDGADGAAGVVIVWEYA